jgi:hypothetical protein
MGLCLRARLLFFLAGVARVDDRFAADAFLADEVFFVAERPGDLRAEALWLAVFFRAVAVFFRAAPALAVLRPRVAVDRFAVLRDLEPRFAPLRPAVRDLLPAPRFPPFFFVAMTVS